MYKRQVCDKKESIIYEITKWLWKCNQDGREKTLIAVDTILIMLRLSLLRTHTTERIRPSRTKTILAPAQAVRTPSDSERCRSDGARAANGRMLTMSAAILTD